MDQSSLKKFSPSRDFETGRLDMSDLVGCTIKIFSEQVPGKELTGEVIVATDNEITIAGGRRHQLIENLVNGQKVVLQFSYRGQEISVKAKLKRTEGGQNHFIFDDVVTPLSQRRFTRLAIAKPVRLAVLPLTGFLKGNLAKLRWMETNLVNFSSGGVLATVPSSLVKETCLILNIVLEKFVFPKMILGWVRHCYHKKEDEFRIGVEFMLDDEAKHHFSSAVMRSLPRSMFTYTRADRDKLNKELAESESPTSDSELTGVKNEK